MRRRTFCAAGLATLAAATFPGRRLWGATGELEAATLNGRHVTLTPAEMSELRAALRGELLTAGDSGYDSARRLWNPAFDHRPALIARCAGAADVMHAVSFAAAHGLLTAVRGGGHSLSGQSGCDGGIVIDVSAMGGVRVDPVAKRARVESGVLLGQFDREAQAFGLATTAGTAADTGIAGLTLGGGVGRIGRKFGLSCDNLTAVDVVTADGHFLRTSAAENPELFWGLRGGGGNFGVVTSFEYRLHPVGPMLFGGTVSYPFADARAVLHGFADFIAGAPDELYVDVALQPGESGQRVVLFDVCYCGPSGQGESVVAPLRRLGKPLQDHLAPALYVKLQGATEPQRANDNALYMKGGLIHELSPALIDPIVDYFEGAPFPGGAVFLQHQGGAIARVAPGATAYWNRKALFNLMMAAFWKVPSAGPGSQAVDAAAAGSGWVRTGWGKLEHFTAGYYVNLSDQDAQERRVHAAYGDNYPRLVSLKKRYDPANLFRLNANIKPV
jgi:FAD/FMN-containing dehydrogenase